MAWNLLKPGSLVVCLAMLLFSFGCGGDGDSQEPIDGDQEADLPDYVSCSLDIECGDGEICGIDGYCIPDPGQDDGDQPDPADGDDVEIDGDFAEGPNIRCPEEIQFGSVLLGESRGMPIEIFSTGNEELRINAIEITQNFDEFSISTLPDFPSFLAPGVSLTLNVNFEPSFGHEAEDRLQIASNAGNTPLCTIMLRSEYKGTSIFEADPRELLFGNVRVEDPGIELPLNICNAMDLEDGNKAIAITAIAMKFSDTIAHFSFDSPVEPRPQTPVFLNPGQCFEINVSYDPTEQTFWPEEHRNFLIIEHDADMDGELAGTGRSEILIAGTANQDSLYVAPNPIDFGMIEIGQNDAISLTIQNQTVGDVEIAGISLGGNHCEEFSLYLGDHSEFPFVLGNEETLTDIGVGYEPTNVGPDDGCKLIIESDLQGAAKFSKTNVSGSGREPNQKPVARISRSDNGPDITQPIDIPSNATEEQKRIAFYGDISMDPDRGYPLTYKWVLTKPPESNAVIWQSDTEPVISVQTDWPGLYTMELVVTDVEGLASNPKTVLISVGGNEKIMIDMEFTGDGESNVNLLWRAPNGTFCSDESMNTQRTCNMADYGFPIVSTNTTQYSNGNRETIVHTGAPDGAYVIQAVYDEDCSGWLPLVIPICLGRENADVTIRITLNDDTEPSWVLTDRLTEKGQIAEWYINKVGGQWNEPQ